MVTMVTKQRIFDQLYLFETFKDEPTPHKNFTFLGQGGYEITEGSAKTLGIRRVNHCLTFYLVVVLCVFDRFQGYV